MNVQEIIDAYATEILLLNRGFTKKTEQELNNACQEILDKKLKAFREQKHKEKNTNEEIETTVEKLKGELVFVKNKFLESCFPPHLENTDLNNPILFSKPVDSIKKAKKLKSDSDVIFETKIKEILLSEGISTEKQAKFLAKAISNDLKQILTKTVQLEPLNEKETSENFLDLVRAAANRYSLNALFLQLEKEFGIALANKILDDSTILGKDITENRRIFTDNDKGRILKKAQRKKIATETYKQEMPKLTRKLHTGERPILRTDTKEIIEESLKGTFSKLHNVLSSSNRGDFELDFTLTLDNYFLDQQAKHPEIFLPDPLEKFVFTALGLHPEYVIQDKVKLFHEIKNTIQENFLQNQKLESVPSIEEIIEEFHWLAFRKRLEMAGGDLQDANKITDAISLMRYMDKLLNKFMKDFETLEDLIRKEYQKDYQGRMIFLEKIIVNNREKYYKNLQDESFNIIKKLFYESDSAPEEIREIFDELMQEQKNNFQKEYKKTLDAACIENSKYNKDWNYPIANEMVQGWKIVDGKYVKDRQDIFIEGVCKAVTVRLMLQEQNHPEENLDPTQIGVTPSDRKLQATYQVTPEYEDNKFGGKNEAHQWEKNLGVASINFIGSESTSATQSDITFETLTKRLEEITSDELDAHEGLIQITLDFQDYSHATYVRMDLKRKIMKFFDPNVGESVNFFNHQLPNQQFPISVEQVRKNMIACFKQTLENTYKDDKILYARLQSYDIVKKKPTFKI